MKILYLYLYLCNKNICNLLINKLGLDSKKINLYQKEKGIIYNNINLIIICSWKRRCYVIFSITLYSRYILCLLCNPRCLTQQYNCIEFIRRRVAFIILFRKIYYKCLDLCVYLSNFK